MGVFANRGNPHKHRGFQSRQHPATANFDNSNPTLSAILQPLFSISWGACFSFVPDSYPSDRSPTCSADQPQAATAASGPTARSASPSLSPMNVPTKPTRAREAHRLRDTQRRMCRGGSLGRQGNAQKDSVRRKSALHCMSAALSAARWKEGELARVANCAWPNSLERLARTAHRTPATELSAIILLDGNSSPRPLADLRGTLRLAICLDCCLFATDGRHSKPIVSCPLKWFFRFVRIVIIFCCRSPFLVP